MATTTKPGARAVGWVDVPVAAESWASNIGGLVALEGPLFAANCAFGSFAVLDGSRNGPPRVVSEAKPAHRFTTLQFLPEWPALAVLGDKGLELFDVSNPEKPTVRLRSDEAGGHRRAAAFMGGELYVTHENGVASVNPRSGKLTQLFDVPNDDFFGNYPSGLAVSGSFLFVTGRHAGLHVYERRAASQFELRRSVKKGYTPTRSEWWTRDVLLLIGNEDIIPVDATAPGQAVVHKSCKLKGVELTTGLTRLSGRRAFVGGARGSKLVFAELDLAKPLSPAVVETQVVGDSKTDFRSSYALRVGQQVFVGSAYLERLHVFRRA